ncbi:MAG: CO dehydrogenase/CO-methylating acetyl-CoA synthase complex subunit beta [Theionarchaea archaeon]|nr:CO dehydrogenase/CO-methylating acetyl-CoA synthase complex subunit beta [Theionarchaea archaeon]MBU6999202.1 CO dehydrogenase/CO-methylating acetyl-CoA synthase complex subunit beta [Theionarchaea archaeon]MBU7019673.1 CO dehydrogenase/CO-methylating acetyl-CoA synthase complex subunit beta [Theionarchaea archaeon]MBU7034595.1 CO dehydrogenase/CO-methylating acetyl-CoA synthase complex subunit beta [Theionarchaea archaeon]MBU7041319.1 CO dehydrogenase/CO-methylating acetyl-CoA synthase comp
MEKECPVEIGVVFEGERVRRDDMYVELGGIKVPNKAELVRCKSVDEVEDGKVIIKGLDIKDMEEGSQHPFGILVEVAGEQVEPDLEAVIERRIHDFSNYVEGFMHVNQRYDIWCRLSKKSYQKGLDSFRYLGEALTRLFKAELPIIEKMQVTFMTDEADVKPFMEEAKKIYEARDARARALSDDDVEEFYGCVLCQSFAPTHVCVITPDRISLCGAINWFDGRAAARVDPKGPNFRVEKGELLDKENFEYSGINEVVKEKSLGENERFWLHTMFGYPHTSCGCFEAIAFFIPEVEGIGIAHRNYQGETVIGVPFVTLATQTGGGKQLDGFLGIAIEYMRSPKFFQTDGGWDRIVWMPQSIKEQVKDAIPENLYDKIATEEITTSINELKQFLQDNDHPVVKLWTAKKEEPGEVMEAEELEVIPVGAGGGLGGVRIILKNARIHADKMIIRRK